jgi:F420-non-reducing hydrogenase iron-sulfur subunit
MEEKEPKILTFLCNWCSYAAADLTGTSRIQYPPNVKVIRVPCSGRVNPQFLVKAFHDGVDGVWVSGCHLGDCHYTEGNYYAQRRFLIIKSLLEYIGIESERIHFSWISASEGKKFADIATKVTQDLKKLDSSPVILAKKR